jgi:hypothetical protein
MAHRSVSRNRMASVIVLFGLAALVLAAGPARAQALIKVTDVITFRVGAYLQAQADWTQLANSTNTDTIGYQQNLYIRRARILLGGRLASDIYFYVDTDNSRLGFNKSGTSALGSGFQLLDAIGEWRVADAFILDGGVLPVPYSREAMTSSSAEFFFDASAYDYLQQTATGSTGGNRDNGFLARGYFLDHRLEYRVGAFQGVRLTGSRNAYRAAGRLQWEFFDREDMYSPGVITSTFYPGAYFGDKKVLAAGAGFDTQMDYRYYSADIFASLPTGKAGSIEGKLQYQYVNGGTTFTSIPVLNTFQVDLGYFISSAKIAPIVRYEQRAYNGQEAKNDHRFAVGLNYCPYRNNFNVKAVFYRVEPKTGVSLNEFALQLQVMYF